MYVYISIYNHVYIYICISIIMYIYDQAAIDSETCIYFFKFLL